jgi:mitochondrial import inner membrane translocase subunit TIM23|eukprot:g3951.t1
MAAYDSYGGGKEDKYDSNSDAANQTFVNPFAGIENVDIGGHLQSPGSSVEYLDGYKGRGLYERLSYNTGVSYLSGIGLGGLYGAVEGLQNAPSRKFKIRLNSFLNSAGKRGSRAGNMLATLAMMFSMMEAGIEQVELDHYVPRELAEVGIPTAAGFATGVVYKMTRGPKIMGLYGLMGAGIMFSLYGGSKLLKQRKSISEFH